MLVTSYPGKGKRLKTTDLLFVDECSKQMFVGCSDVQETDAKAQALDLVDHFAIQFQSLIMSQVQLNMNRIFLRGLCYPGELIRRHSISSQNKASLSAEVRYLTVL